MAEGFDAVSEFEKQVLALKKLGLIDEKENLGELRRLLLQETLTDLDLNQGTIPFIVVPHLEKKMTSDLMKKIVLNGKPGMEKLTPLSPVDFVALPETDVPNTPYLLVGINRGAEFLNVTPEKARKIILGRTQKILTIEEGVSILLQYPEFLMRNNCFSLLGSRHAGDQRVPALWINGKRHPNLGWCWDRNPHMWLGSAFAQKRISR